MYEPNSLISACEVVSAALREHSARSPVQARLYVAPVKLLQR